MSENNVKKLRTYSELQNFWHNTMKDICGQPYAHKVEPFHILDNLCYVGDDNVCIHLIDTGDGLVLIDTGYATGAFQYLANIVKLGYNPEDIKYIIHTHEHFDHWGATNDFVQMFGCKTMMSRIGAKMIEHCPESTLYKEVPQCSFASPMDFKTDVLIEDGDTFELGNTKFLFRETPGHSEGVITIFFNAEQNGKSYRCALFGGATMLTTYHEHMRRYPGAMDLQQAYLTSIERVRNEAVDVVLGNHTMQNNTLGKRTQMLEGDGENPFINPDEWEAFLSNLQDTVEQFIEFDKDK